MTHGITPAQALTLKRLANAALQAAGGVYVAGAQAEIAALTGAIDALVVEPRRWLSTGDVARQMGTSVRTVQQWVNSGALRADVITDGGHRRITVEALDEFKARRAATRGGTHA